MSGGWLNLTAINQRRLENFKANRRGYWSLWIFLVLFVLSLGSEFIANDKPILAYYKGELLAPVLIDYPEEKFGGFLAITDIRCDPRGCSSPTREQTQRAAPVQRLLRSQAACHTSSYRSLLFRAIR